MADSLIKPLPGLWGRCEYHRVLVKTGTRCAACALLNDKGDAMGATGAQLRGEHFEIGEPQPGWSTEVATERPK
jgi:hypothetical protein